MTAPPGNDMTSGLLPRCLASLQDKMPLNHSTENRRAQGGAGGRHQQSSSQLSLFVAQKTPEASASDGHIIVLPLPWPHCS